MADRSSCPPATLPAGAVISIRAHRRQRELIDGAAELLGRNRSEFMLDAACRAAENVLLDQVAVRLDREAWERFNAMLEAPPQENPGMRALLARRPSWER
jgi:uncharacterized protein (DUF1778 family)